jgi:hypothetical protein
VKEFSNIHYGPFSGILSNGTKNILKTRKWIVVIV